MKLQGSSVLEHKTITQILSSRLNWLWFPKKLEKDYQAQYCREAAHEFRYRGLIIFFLYLILIYGIYKLVPAEQMNTWLPLYSMVGVIVLLATMVSWLGKLYRWFDYVIGVGGALVIAISVIAAAITTGEQANILLHAAIIYAVVVVYGFVGLRFYTAMAAGWIGGLIGLAVSFYLSADITWTVLNRTYTFAGLLGMALAYAIDRQHRENYLQSCLLELNRLEMIGHNEQLEILSRQDALTGISNRRHLDEMLKDEWFRAMRHQTPLTIMMIDIDCFKAYNDVLGHIDGDKCLIKVADTIKKLAARSGELVARYGGEEFLMLLPMTDQKQAAKQAERLLKAISSLKIAHPNSEVSAHVTLSIGVATYVPQLNEQVSDFLSFADQALYKAKSAGRNSYYVVDLQSESLNQSLAS